MVEDPAALHAVITRLELERARILEAQARLEQENAELRAQLGMTDADYMPLKKATGGLISSEGARQLCLKGLVRAQRVGARWLVSKSSLQAYLTRLGRHPAPF